MPTHPCPLCGQVHEIYVAPPPPPPPPPQSVWTVKPSGTADDRPAIQKAVDAAAKVAGSVYMTAGTYLIASGVVPASFYARMGVYVRAGVTLYGDGPLTKLKSSGDGMNTVGAAGEANVTIRDLVLIGGPQDGLKFGQCAKLTIKRVQASGHYIGIAAYGCPDVLIADSIGHDNSGFGLCVGDDVTNKYPQVGAIRQRVENCEAHHNSEGLRIHDGGSATFSCCYSHDNKTGLLATRNSDLTVDHGRYLDNKLGWGGIALAGVKGAHVIGPVMTGNKANTVQQVMAANYGACTGVVIEA